jgi:hypothetical protein
VTNYGNCRGSFSSVWNNAHFDRIISDTPRVCRRVCCAARCRRDPAAGPRSARVGRSLRAYPRLHSTAETIIRAARGCVGGGWHLEAEGDPAAGKLPPPKGLEPADHENRMTTDTSPAARATTPLTRRDSPKKPRHRGSTPDNTTRPRRRRGHRSPGSRTSCRQAERAKPRADRAGPPLSW